MAEYLKTDYVDDELDTDINENRVFDIVDGNGTVIQSGVSFVDRSAYTHTGDDYGANQINEQNTFINGLKTSFSQALTDLKATAIAQAVGATVSDTFAQVIAKLATVVNRGKVTQTLNTSTKSYTIPAGYHNGEGTVSITTQEKTVTGSRSAQTVTPDSGKVLSKVTVNKYPDASGNYPTSGNITSNGTHDMGATNNYRYVKVAVNQTPSYRSYSPTGTNNYYISNGDAYNDGGCRVTVGQPSVSKNGSVITVTIPETVRYGGYWLVHGEPTLPSQVGEVSRNITVTLNI